MKKLFTLIALMACFIGAKAEWIQDYKIDYSDYNGFPFYVMGYVPEWVDGVMVDKGANYAYTAAAEATEAGESVWTNNKAAEYIRTTLTEPAWHQYFVANGITTELDGNYTVKAMVKASEACEVKMNFQWSWSSDPVSTTINVGTDWQEIEMEFNGIGGTSSWIVAQPGTVTAQIEWKYITVSHNQKEQRPVEWIEHLTNGNAETPWGDLANTAYNDADNNTKICAWGKENGHNLNDDGGSNPVPATIEVDPDDATNHVFVVHATDCTDASTDASAWDNQFWIESPQGWKSGTQIRIQFRYKASQTAKTNTQMHHQTPSDYQIWYAIGDVTFTTEWQEFDKTITIDDSQAGAYSIAFNLNPDVKTATDFYFDNLSWSTMKLDEGYFVAGANTNTGIEYDLDNATQFTYDDNEGCLVATVGEKNAYVNQIMISTVRGNDAAFKGATLKPKDSIVNDPDTWSDYSASSLAKLTLPTAGIWKIYIDEAYSAMAFEMLEGDAAPTTIEINPNPTVVVVKGLERDYTSAEQDGGTGAAWDNQFFILANRTLSAGEETVIEFDYVGSTEAKTTTQCHGAPGAYIHWSAIGDVTFTTEEQHFSQDFTIPTAADGMQSIAFNMAEIKGACNYTIKNIVWKLKSNTESLINQTGAENFYVKEGAGTAPYIFGTSGISNVTTDNTKATATYNIAGQRVANNYKGIVVKNGRKQINK